MKRIINRYGVVIFCLMCVAACCCAQERGTVKAGGFATADATMFSSPAGKTPVAHPAGFDAALTPLSPVADKGSAARIDFPAVVGTTSTRPKGTVRTCVFKPEATPECDGVVLMPGAAIL